MDLWCAPTITGLYALLTHAQPFWGELHELLAQVLGATSVGEPVKALDPEQARAVCALLLSGLFLGRTVKNFGLWKPFPQKIGSYPFFILSTSADILCTYSIFTEPKSKTQ